MRTREHNPNTNLILTSPQTITRHRTIGHRFLLVIGGLVLVGLLAYSAICAYVATQLTRPDRHSQSTSPAAYGLSFEQTTVTSRDGLLLAGWFIPAAGSERAIVLVHGKGNCRSCEFEGRFVEFAARLQGEGFNILLIDLRAHGQSEGRNFTLGDQERWDVLGAVDWLEQRGFAKIGALGVSLGAASTVMAASDTEGGHAIQALVLDSCYADLRDLLEGQFTKESGLPNTFLPGSLFMARLLLQTNANAVKPVEDLSQIEIPVMLIFGGQDDLVPAQHFHTMMAVRPDVETWLVTDAAHARIYNAEPEEYVTRVSRFFAETLR